MKLRRSDVRHACYRAKNDIFSEATKHIIDMIESKMEIHHKWNDFSKKWDVIVADGEIHLIEPENDYSFIHSTLLEISFLVKRGISLDEISPRQKNIVIMIEQNMLDGIMTWENYNVAWGFEIDKISNTIRTKMFNAPSNQIEVTDDMIKSSMKEADGSEYKESSLEEANLELKPMNAEMKKAFNKFLKKKNK